MKDEDNVERCDKCLTWVATHEVQIGEDVYHVCDKPRCQDSVDALRETDSLTAGRVYDYAYLESTYHADRQTIEVLLPLIREKYQLQDVPPEILEREIAKTYEQIVLDEAIEQLREEQDGTLTG